MQLPLKVNLGFRLHLWRSADLCLISFRCWVAPVCSGKGGAGLPVGSSVGDSFTHACTHTHVSCPQPISAVRVYTAASVCMEKQSYLCTRDGFKRLSAAPVRQHTARQGRAETNGKANIRLISEEGEECAGERSERRLTAAINSAPSFASHQSSMFECN